jgi:hypothetical protein
MLSFFDGDSPLIDGSFAIDDLAVLWPKKLPSNSSVRAT